MGDRSISKVPVSWLNRPLSAECAGLSFCCLRGLALPLKVEAGIDGTELDGEVLQEGEDGRSVKVPWLFYDMVVQLATVLLKANKYPILCDWF